jgi:WbqC-like protein family
MGKKVAILQSGYLPWKGYFDIIANVDLFIFYDDVQFTKNDWRNRNKIKTPKGVEWLTVPCGPNINRKICEVELDGHVWQKKHWKTIVNNYNRAKYFKEYKEFFYDFYINQLWINLSDMNQYIIKKIARNILDIQTQFDDSRNYRLGGRSDDRLLELLKNVKATEYLSGPSAKNYISPLKFEQEGIKLTWMDYLGYKEYTQLYPPFDHNVSIIDLVFNEGPNSKNFIKSHSI